MRIRLWIKTLFGKGATAVSHPNGTEVGMNLHIWMRRVAIAMGIEAAIGVATLTWTIVDSGVQADKCKELPPASEEEQIRIADEELDFQARQVGLTPARFFHRKDPEFGGFIFQVKGDREQPRQIVISVDHCLHTGVEFHNLHPPG